MDNDPRSPRRKVRALRSGGLNSPARSPGDRRTIRREAATTSGLQVLLRYRIWLGFGTGPEPTADYRYEDIRVLQLPVAALSIGFTTNDCQKTYEALLAKERRVHPRTGRAAVRHRYRPPRSVRESHSHRAAQSRIIGRRGVT